MEEIYRQKKDWKLTWERKQSVMSMVSRVFGNCIQRIHQFVAICEVTKQSLYRKGIEEIGLVDAWGRLHCNVREQMAALKSEK